MLWTFLNISESLVGGTYSDLWREISTMEVSMVFVQGMHETFIKCAINPSTSINSKLVYSKISFRVISGNLFKC